MYGNNTVIKDSETMVGFDMAANELNIATDTKNYNRKQIDRLVSAVMIDLNNYNISYSSFKKYFNFVTSSQFYLMYGIEVATSFAQALMNANVTYENNVEGQELANYMQRLEQFISELAVGVR